jgi:hypothetical protein
MLNQPPQQSIHSNYLSASLSFDMSYSWCKLGPSFCYTPIFNMCSHVPFMLLDIILVCWRHQVASSEALDRLHQAMRAVVYRYITMAIETASKVGVFVHHC